MKRIKKKKKILIFKKQSKKTAIKYQKMIKINILAPKDIQYLLN